MTTRSVPPKRTIRKNAWWEIKSMWKASPKIPKEDGVKEKYENKYGHM